MAFEGDQGSMANTLFPIYQCQTSLNVGLNGGVQDLGRSYVLWSHNTPDDPYELINSAQDHIKNRKPFDISDDGETELQGLVSNILDETNSQDSFYSDGSLSQHSNNIWSPKLLQDELLQCFQSEHRNQYSSNFAPNYTSHDAFGIAQGKAANKDAEELCQPNGVRDVFSTQHGPHKPPPGLCFPTNAHITPSKQNNYDSIPVSKERGNKEPMSSFPDISHVFRPQSEMNGADLLFEDHYNQGIEKPAANEQYTSQDFNQLVNSFQSLVAAEGEKSEFPDVSIPTAIQREDNLADKWRSLSHFVRPQGTRSVQRELGPDFGTTRNSASRKQLFKRDSHQDLSTFSLQTSDYSPQAKPSLEHPNKMLSQRETAYHPLNINQFSKHQIQQSPLKFKPQMQEKRMAGFFGKDFNTRAISSDISPEEKHPVLMQNPFYDLQVNTRPVRFVAENNMNRTGTSQQFMPFMYHGSDTRGYASHLQTQNFSPRSSLVYRGSIPSIDVGDMVSTNEISEFSLGFNHKMRRGGENTYYGMSPTMTAPVQMDQGEPVIQLFFYLDECYQQARYLEKERKRTEVVLSKTFLGKRTTAFPTSSLPKTPPNPSKIDLLINTQMREQARVSSLLDKMECLSGVPINANIYTALSNHHSAICVTSARRRKEINMSHSQHQRALFTEDKVSDTMLLVVALKDLAASTRKLCTAVWCALQMTLPKPTPRPEPSIKEEKPDNTGPAPCEGYSYRLS